MPDTWRMHVSLPRLANPQGDLECVSYATSTEARGRIYFVDCKVEHYCSSIHCCMILRLAWSHGSMKAFLNESRILKPRTANSCTALSDEVELRQ